MYCEDSISIERELEVTYAAVVVVQPVSSDKQTQRSSALDLLSLCSPLALPALKVQHKTLRKGFKEGQEDRLEPDGRSYPPIV